MRFRTKIFLGWTALTLALLGGTFLAVRHSVKQSFGQMAGASFRALIAGCTTCIGSVLAACARRASWWSTFPSCAP
jgi:hypothetical protein